MNIYFIYKVGCISSLTQSYEIHRVIRLHAGHPLSFVPEAYYETFILCVIENKQKKNFYFINKPACITPLASAYTCEVVVL